jgi:hypothetical protein
VRCNFLREPLGCSFQLKDPAMAHLQGDVAENVESGPDVGLHVVS